MHDILEKFNSFKEKTCQTMVWHSSHQSKNNASGDKQKYIDCNKNAIVLTLVFVTAAWLNFLRGGHFSLHVKYLGYYFENLYHCRLFSPLTNSIQPNVAKRQSEWSEKGISEKNDFSLTKCISQPSIDSLIRILHRELTAKLFTSVCCFCCFCVQRRDSKCVCVCERDETDRQR